MKLLYIDLFCGAGGTSTGVENARHDGRQCAKVIGCVNHDANAIASHAANHPDALHFTEDIRTLELSPLTAHIAEMRRQYPDAFVVLWASLECTNFSKAKGGQPRDADSRTLAEHLFRYIEAINPDYIQIENVEEFMSWGDLDENGKPISKDAGRLYQQWVSNVCGYGYRFAHRILNSADYGAYTTRRRFFGIFAKESLPIVFPEPTHSKDGATGLFGRTQRWKPVREVQPYIIPACGVGAPHRRDRCWFVAHRADAGSETMRERSNGVHADSIASDTPCLGRITRRSKSNRTIQNEKIGSNIYVPVERSGSKRTFTDPDSERCEECNASGQSGHTQGRTIQEGDAKRRIPDWNGFPTQPPVCGGDDGFPGELAGIAFPRWRREAVKACGNAIVPQVALQIFETINEYEKI